MTAISRETLLKIRAQLIERLERVDAKLAMFEAGKRGATMCKHFNEPFECVECRVEADRDLCPRCHSCQREVMLWPCNDAVKRTKGIMAHAWHMHEVLGCQGDNG